MQKYCLVELHRIYPEDLQLCIVDWCAMCIDKLAERSQLMFWRRNSSKADPEKQNLIYNAFLSLETLLCNHKLPRVVVTTGPVVDGGADVETVVPEDPVVFVVPVVGLVDPDVPVVAVVVVTGNNRKNSIKKENLLLILTCKKLSERDIVPKLSQNNLLMNIQYISIASQPTRLMKILSLVAEFE